MVNIQENISLAPFTTFRIGGPAKYFAAVADEGELAQALRYARERELSVFILGGGSNILFSDQGFDGLVVKIENGSIEQSGNQFKASAGTKLTDVVSFACAHGLAGVENLAGIPGSLGGAVRGNAGAFGAEIGNVVTGVTAFNRDTLEVKMYSKQECGFSYRKSFFKQHPEWLVFSVEMEFVPGDKGVLEKTAVEIVAKREAKHPQAALCAGSFFMNPSVNDEKLRQEFERESGLVCKDDKLPAGWLIDHVGLRGKKVGGAMISEIHPNYLINAGGATAEEVIMLSSLVKQKVRTQLGVQLQEEVQMVGF